MDVIEHVKVTCREQEDWTGSDDLHFYLDQNFLGRLTISTGETMTFDRSAVIAGGRHIFVEPGQTLEVYEHDTLDPSDLLLRHTIDDSELGKTVSLGDTAESANYTFEVKFFRA